MERLGQTGGAAGGEGPGGLAPGRGACRPLRRPVGEALLQALLLLAGVGRVSVAADPGQTTEGPPFLRGALAVMFCYAATGAFCVSGRAALASRPGSCDRGLGDRWSPLCEDAGCGPTKRPQG